MSICSLENGRLQILQNFLKTDMEKTTLTIGIPAYNEEANIEALLRNLLKQKKRNFILEKILVYSDGSTDRTEKMVRKYKKRGVTLKLGTIRGGIAYAQNQIIKKSRSHILVILNADILLAENNFLEKIIEPFAQKEKVGLVSTKVIPSKPLNFFESILNFSQNLKNQMARDLTIKNNIYLCRGAAKALSKKFYKGLAIPPTFADDSYCYLRCIETGFSFVYLNEVGVIYRSPRNLKDHINQSSRFYKSRDELKKYFKSEIVDDEYDLPKNVLIKTAINGFLRDPIRTLFYSLVLVFSNFVSASKFIRPKILWDFVQSSKKVKI